MKTRFTVWTRGHDLAEQLGLSADGNSIPDLFEWYYTLPTNDATAFVQLLVEAGYEFGCCHIP